MSREAIIAAHPIEEYAKARGWELRGKNGELLTLCPFHDDHHPSMRINTEKQVWRCDPCDIGGSVIDLYARLENVDTKEAFKRLLPDEARNGNGNGRPAAPIQMKHVATYEYEDAHGRQVFCVDRMESANGAKKKFVQWHTKNGTRVNNVDGVSKCLYRLPLVTAGEDIWLVEGEKCVHACEALGIVATTNPGGSGAWLPAYAEFLRGKDVTLCPDEDESGTKWTDTVMRSLEGIVRTLRVCHVPKPYNDIADMLLALDVEKTGATMHPIMESVPRIPRGIDIPVYSADEMMARYHASVRGGDFDAVDLGKWLPSFRRYSRPLSPGDLFVVLAATGGGKTAIAQNIAASQKDRIVLLFELELGAEQMAERFSSITHNTHAREVESTVKSGGTFSTKDWAHVWTCPQGKLTIADMEDYIVRSELKIGRRPHLVIVDYIGLVQGGAGKRYERMSSIAEDLKVMARSTGTVVGVCSQVRRQNDDDASREVSVNDGKDSGSIENSAQLVLGAWRPVEDPTQMNIRILKRTNGGGGDMIECNFHGPTLRITERAMYMADEADLDDWKGEL